jgi:uncharacterized protein YjiS (DUF1127 family)
MRATPALRGGDCTAHRPRNAALEALDGIARQIRDRLGRLRRRLRHRRELTALARFDDRMLRDIGLTRSDAEFLINKPFWRE